MAEDKKQSRKHILITKGFKNVLKSSLKSKKIRGVKRDKTALRYKEKTK